MASVEPGLSISLVKFGAALERTYEQLRRNPIHLIAHTAGRAGAVPIAHVSLTPSATNQATEQTKPQRQPIGPKRRLAIMQRDGFRCQLCGQSAQDGVKLEIDHKLPISKGGTNDDPNLWVLCWACNAGKRDQIL